MIGRLIKNDQCTFEVLDKYMEGEYKVKGYGDAVTSTAVHSEYYVIMHDETKEIKTISCSRISDYTIVS